MLTTPNFFRLEIAYSELEVYQQVMDPPFDVRAVILLPIPPESPTRARADYLSY